VYGFYIGPVRMHAHLLKSILFLADQDTSYGTADKRERAELSKEGSSASSKWRQVIGNFALLSVYSHGGYIPPAKTQIHQLIKLYNNFKSESFTVWIYSGRVTDVIHNNLTHLCVFVSFYWLLNMTVSGIQA
jgi:hypothetical protein